MKNSKKDCSEIFNISIILENSNHFANHSMSDLKTDLQLHLQINITKAKKVGWQISREQK